MAQSSSVLKQKTLSFVLSLTLVFQSGVADASNPGSGDRSSRVGNSIQQPKTSSASAKNSPGRVWALTRAAVKCGALIGGLAAAGHFLVPPPNMDMVNDASAQGKSVTWAQIRTDVSWITNKLKSAGMLAVGQVALGLGRDQLPSEAAATWRLNDGSDLVSITLHQSALRAQEFNADLAAELNRSAQWSLWDQRAGRLLAGTQSGLAHLTQVPGRVYVLFVDEGREPNVDSLRTLARLLELSGLGLVVVKTRKSGSIKRTLVRLLSSIGLFKLAKDEASGAQGAVTPASAASPQVQGAIQSNDPLTKQFLSMVRFPDGLKEFAVGSRRMAVGSYAFTGSGYPRIKDGNKVVYLSKNERGHAFFEVVAASGSLMLIRKEELRDINYDYKQDQVELTDLGGGGTEVLINVSSLDKYRNVHWLKHLFRVKVSGPNGTISVIRESPGYEGLINISRDSRSYRFIGQELEMLRAASRARTKLRAAVLREIDNRIAKFTQYVHQPRNAEPTVGYLRKAYEALEYPESIVSEAMKGYNLESFVTSKNWIQNEMLLMVAHHRLGILRKVRAHRAGDEFLRGFISPVADADKNIVDPFSSSDRHFAHLDQLALELESGRLRSLIDRAHFGVSDAEVVQALDQSLAPLVRELGNLPSWVAAIPQVTRDHVWFHIELLREERRAVLAANPSLSDEDAALAILQNTYLYGLLRNIQNFEKTFEEMRGARGLESIRIQAGLRQEAARILSYIERIQYQLGSSFADKPALVAGLGEFLGQHSNVIRTALEAIKQDLPQMTAEGVLELDAKIDHSFAELSREVSSLSAGLNKKMRELSHSSQRVERTSYAALSAANDAAAMSFLTLVLK